MVHVEIERCIDGNSASNPATTEFLLPKLHRSNITKLELVTQASLETQNLGLLPALNGFLNSAFIWHTRTQQPNFLQIIHC